MKDAALVLGDERWRVQADPTEGALLVAARKFGIQRVAEIPFTLSIADWLIATAVAATLLALMELVKWAARGRESFVSEPAEPLKAA